MLPNTEYMLGSSSLLGSSWGNASTLFSPLPSSLLLSCIYRSAPPSFSLQFGESTLFAAALGLLEACVKAFTCADLLNTQVEL